jgi:glycine oxidase
MLAPGGEMDDDTPLTRMALRSLAQYSEFLQELRDASDVAMEYRDCGAVTIALTEDEATALERKAVRQAAIGIHSEPTTFDGATAGRFYPEDALVNPREITAALRVACVRSGVTIHEHEPVFAILNAGAGVRTPAREYADDDGVLIASGAWSSRLVPEFLAGLPEVIPVRGHLIAWRPSNMLVDRMLRHGHTYVVQRRCASGRPGPVIAGGSMETVAFNRSLDEEVCADVHRRAARLVPALADMAPTERWNGLRPSTVTNGPLIGRIPDTRIWTAFGHHRNGILLAPETARIIAESWPG